MPRQGRRSSILAPTPFSTTQNTCASEFHPYLDSKRSAHFFASADRISGFKLPLSLSQPEERTTRKQIMRSSRDRLVADLLAHEW